MKIGSIVTLPSELIHAFNTKSKGAYGVVLGVKRKMTGLTDVYVYWLNGENPEWLYSVNLEEVV